MEGQGSWKVRDLGRSGIGTSVLGPDDKDWGEGQEVVGLETNGTVFLSRKITSSLLMLSKATYKTNEQANIGDGWQYVMTVKNV